MVNKERDKPLQCEVEDGQLVIRIGINTLAWSAEHLPDLYDDETNPEPPYCKVVDNEELARDVRNMLLAEEEDGTTPLHVLLDKAISDAMEDGSLAFAEE